MCLVWQKVFFTKKIISQFSFLMKNIFGIWSQKRKVKLGTIDHCSRSFSRILHIAGILVHQTYPLWDNSKICVHFILPTCKIPLNFLLLLLITETCLFFPSYRTHSKQTMLIKKKCLLGIYILICIWCLH